MSVPVAYATMIVIWSTTPLGIAWSNETFSPIAAVALRMSVAAVVGWMLLRAFKIELAWHGAALKTYGYSLMSVYCAMMLVYVSAQYIPSGLISVLFALSPLMANFMSVKVLGQGAFTPMRTLAFMISLSGLAVICLNDWEGYNQAWIGIGLLLSSVVLYSLSGVLVQREGERNTFHAHPLSITVGTLLLSTPLFGLTWLLLDGEVPQVNLSDRSLWAVLYLAIIGSLLGFACYFHVIRKLGAIAVAMVTLITPVFALILGSLLNGEAITLQMVIGTACVLIGLVMYYQNGSAAEVEDEPITQSSPSSSSG